MTDAEAEALASTALEWLANHDELFPVFAGSTGIDMGGIDRNAPERDLLVATLSFLTMDDAWVIAFCDAHTYAYEQPLRAMSQLEGEAGRHWT